MKDIYELLNDAQMDLEEFENYGTESCGTETPGNKKLSEYERIMVKKKVLKELQKKAIQNKKKAWKRALVTAAACACAIIGMGTVSVAAGWMQIPGSFRLIFGIMTDEELKVANTMGSAIDIVAKDHGYKISAKGVIGDGKHMGVVFRIEKSDGSMLLANGEAPADVEFDMIKNGGRPWPYAASGKVGGAEHANYMEYYLAFTYKGRAKDHEQISLEHMKLRDETGTVNVPGKWEFDIPFDIQDVSVELAAGQKFAYGNSEGTMDELRISPIGFSVKVTTSDPLAGSDFIDMPMELRLKNGKTVELHGGCGPEDNDDGTWSWREDGVYGNIILFDSVECVVIGDTEFVLRTGKTWHKF